MLSMSPSARTTTPYSVRSTLLLMIEPMMMSHSSSRVTGVPRNSSGMTVSVAAAALPMPRARCPAARPMLTTRYQREVVRASSARLRTICTPSCRAVSKPKVGVEPGSGRSLSMVLGTCATRIFPSALL